MRTTTMVYYLGCIRQHANDGRRNLIENVIIRLVVSRGKIKKPPSLKFSGILTKKARGVYEFYINGIL